MKPGKEEGFSSGMKLRCGHPMQCFSFVYSKSTSHSKCMSKRLCIKAALNKSCKRMHWTFSKVCDSQLASVMRDLGQRKEKRRGRELEDPVHFFTVIASCVSE